MNRYERYKDSGIPWLGKVPEHWETWKITHAIDLIGSGTTPKSDNAEYYDGDILWVTTSELRENFISDTKQKVSDNAIKEYSALKIYPADSVAMAMYGATIGRLGILEREATFNQACCVFGNSKILYYKFLFYWLWHRRPILISLSNGGGQPNLSQDDLKKLKLPIPSYVEQTAIAHYLDTKLGEIDALIDKQQTLLEKLAEQRTAVITHAVTKGLNPAAPMKNSGVEWLGDVPAHWQLINLKFLCRVKGGYAFSSDNFSDEGIPVIRISDILFDGTVDNINCKRIPLELAPNQKDFELRNGQLVMAMTGATIGKISKYCSEDYAYINQRVGKFEVFNSRLNYAFLYHLLNTSGYQEHIKLTAFGGAQPNISDSEMVNYQMVLPTMEEQAHIADYLDKETAKIDRLCDTVNQTIGRLKEYRTALITQAVTGKIKVTDE